MSLTAQRFVAALTSYVPEAEDTIREHVEDQDGELLLHLLTADLLRLAIRWFKEGRNDSLGRLLRVMDRGLREGDEYVSNAMAVSFVGNAGWWESAMVPFLEVWPEGLSSELQRQRRVNPRSSADPEAS